MELTRFHQCVDDEFGHDYGTWILRSHVLSEYGKTSNELLETETNVREIWWALCRDFDVPKERWLAPDL